MTAILVSNAEPGSDEWHAVRATGLGGSDVAAALGLSPWSSPFDLWCRKTGMLPDVIEDNQSMAWGRKLEDLIANEYAERHPGIVVRRTGTWRHGTVPWMLANPDRLFTDRDGVPGVLEIKTARSADEWGDDGTDEVPVHYRVQVLWYCEVLGLDHGHVAALIGGSDYREYRIDREPDEAALIVERCDEFWRSVVDVEAPPLDSSLATYRALRNLHPEITDDSVELEAVTAAAYLEAVENLARAKDAEQAARSAVAAEMGTARTATFRGHKIAGRQTRGGAAPFVVAARNLPTDLLTATERTQP